MYTYIYIYSFIYIVYTIASFTRQKTLVIVAKFSAKIITNK